jgi:hypothetical protein
MRKSIVSPSAAATTPISDLWRDLERIARVEISSEDEQFPIERALGKKETTGWRAAETGPQLIRLHFVDRAAERSQEFAVYAGAGPELKEVVRQQWSFSPHGSTEEIEEYTVNLSGITTLELRIDPDRSHDPKQSQNYASLQSLKLA